MQIPIVPAITSAVVAFLVSLFTERLKHWLSRPDLEVSYENTNAHRIDNTGQRIYIRVKVINKSRNVATNCRAYLVGVVSTASNERLSYDAPLMEWPYMGQKGIDIVSTIDQYLNVAYSVNILMAYDLTHLKLPTSFTSSRVTELENKPESCKLSVVLLADHDYRKKFQIELVWRGTWDTLDAIPFTTEQAKQQRLLSWFRRAYTALHNTLIRWPSKDQIGGS